MNMNRNARNRCFNNHNQSYFRREISRRQHSTTQVSHQTREDKGFTYAFDRNRLQDQESERNTVYHLNYWNKPSNAIEFTRCGAIGQSNYNKNSNNMENRARLVKNVKNTRNRSSNIFDCSKPVDKLDLKIDTFISTIQTQNGDLGQIVLTGKEGDNSLEILQNAIGKTNINLSFIQMGSIHSLRFNYKTFLEGNFPNKQVAKTTLAEQAVSKLKENCFFIIKKENFYEVNSDNLPKTSSNENPSASMEGGKAHQMMLKMGWAPGKGLGLNEQGGQQTVAEITENISRYSLGNKSNNILTEINNVLKSFASSNRLSILAFDPTFTKEERAQIHKMALKFNLKSKSVGKDVNRRVTVSKKVTGFDLVKCLLHQGLESEAYKLIIPAKYVKMWESF